MSSIPSGHTVQNIIGDGNCLFRSISFGLHGDQDHHGRIRQEVVSYVTENWVHYGKFVVGDNSYGRPLKNVGDYARHMSRNGAEGGHVEIAAAANVYNVNIDVHSRRDQRVIQVPTSGGGRRRVLLLYSGSGDSGHYDSIVPVASSRR